MNYRVALTSDEKEQELSGFNMYDGDEEPQIVNCKICEEPYHLGEHDIGICQDCAEQELLDDGSGTIMRGEL